MILYLTSWLYNCSYYLILKNIYVLFRFDESHVLINYLYDFIYFYFTIHCYQCSLRHGHVADVMRRTRAKYHSVIRRIKNDNQLLKNKAKTRAIDKSRELWTEVNKIKSSKSHSTNCMDDVTGSE